MLWRKRRSLDDFADEIQSHLELEASELKSSHRPPPDAGRAARRAFGNITSIKESFYEYRRWRMWDQLSRDIRHALRLFWRRPSFSAVVAITLAVGIGTTLAIFSIINAVLLRPLPYKNPARLAMLWSEDPAHGLLEGRVSLLNFADWKGRSRSFEDMTLFIGQTFLLANNDSVPERMRSARVSEGFFRVLGVSPAVGRVFGTNEEAHREAVVVISYSLWQRRFGGSTQAIGSDC